GGITSLAASFLAFPGLGFATTAAFGGALGTINAPLQTTAMQFATPFVASTAANFSVQQAFAFQPSHLGSFSIGWQMPELLLAAGIGVATVTSAGEMRAYKLDGSYRHFGHNAPAMQVTSDDDGHPVTSPVSYVRSVRQRTLEPANPALDPRHMPLD